MVCLSPTTSFTQARSGVRVERDENAAPKARVETFFHYHMITPARGAHESRGDRRCPASICLRLRIPFADFHPKVPDEVCENSVTDNAKDVRHV